MEATGGWPQGTVTFLFTDIERSTRLLERLGRDRYGELLVAHRTLLRGAVSAQGGTEVDEQGDSTLAVFASAGAAVAAAVEAQRSLASHEWPDGGKVRVRIGLHSGEASFSGNAYVGLAVHRGRRVCDAAHGGQILVSNATRAIVADGLPADVRLVDRGEVRLAGLDEPERLFQIVAEGLPEVAADPRAPRPRREPQQVLLERAEELAAVDAALAAALVGGGRLLVIEGPAGIGKTSILVEARERAAASGFVVLQGRGSEIESAFSFGVVRQLFEAVLAQASPARREQLLAGAAAHAERLFASGAPDEGAGGEDAAFALMHGLYWLALNLAESQPIALAVDDLQWADEPSLRWLAYLARRIENAPIVVLATLRPVESEDPQLTELIVDPATALVRPNALTAPAVTDFARTELSAQAEDEFCSACHRATGGNPLLLRELLRTLAAENVPPARASIDVVERVAPDRSRDPCGCGCRGCRPRRHASHGQFRSSATAPTARRLLRSPSSSGERSPERRRRWRGLTCCDRSRRSASCIRSSGTRSTRPSRQRSVTLRTFGPQPHFVRQGHHRRKLLRNCSAQLREVLRMRGPRCGKRHSWRRARARSRARFAT